MLKSPAKAGAPFDIKGGVLMIWEAHTARGLPGGARFLKLGLQPFHMAPSGPPSATTRRPRHPAGASVAAGKGMARPIGPEVRLFR